MSHRERLMTTEDVLVELELGDENDDLMMPGSDDEFSDCDLDENDGDDNNDNSARVPNSSQPQILNPSLSSSLFSSAVIFNPSLFSSVVILAELCLHQ